MGLHTVDDDEADDAPITGVSGVAQLSREDIYGAYAEARRDNQALLKKLEGYESAGGITVRQGRSVVVAIVMCLTIVEPFISYMVDRFAPRDEDTVMSTVIADENRAAIVATASWLITLERERARADQREPEIPDALTLLVLQAQLESAE